MITVVLNIITSAVLSEKFVDPPLPSRGIKPRIIWNKVRLRMFVMEITRAVITQRIHCGDLFDLANLTWIESISTHNSFIDRSKLSTKLSVWFELSIKCCPVKERRFSVQGAKSIVFLHKCRECSILSLHPFVEHTRIFLLFKEWRGKWHSNFLRELLPVFAGPDSVMAIAWFSLRSV